MVEGGGEAVQENQAKGEGLDLAASGLDQKAKQDACRVENEGMYGTSIGQRANICVHRVNSGLGYQRA